MARAVGRVIRGVGVPFRVALNRPRLLLLTLILFVAGGIVGLWRYAISEWHAARQAIEAENPTLALDHLGLCLEVWRRSPEVHLLAARAERLSGNVDRAEAHLNRCLELQDGATQAVQLEFLLLRVQAGEVDTVAPILISTAQAGHPESALILETLARAYIIRLRYKLAYACLNYWIESQPENAKAYQWRGWVLERLNNHTAATADYHVALKLDPDLLPVRLRVAEMLLEDKQAPEALPHLERLYQQAPDHPLVQARLGMCRYLQGDVEEARRLMEQAAPHLPRDAALHVTLAKIDLQNGMGVEAEKRLRAVLETDPSDTEALYNLASALQLQNRPDEAAAVLADYEKTRLLVDRTNDMLQNVADSPTATPSEYAELGRLLLEVGRDQLGSYWLERALEQDPTNQPAHRTLVAYYERLGDTQRASVHRRQIREPDAPQPVSTDGAQSNQ